MHEYDVGVVGDGAIGVLTALAVASRDPGRRVVLIGNRTLYPSGTVAAGAMHAVFAEVEEPPGTSEDETRIMGLGLEARDRWLRLFDRIGDLRTARDTLVYLKSDASRFELKCFESAKAAAAAHGALESPSPAGLSRYVKGDIRVDDAFLAVGEFSICVTAFFANVDRELDRCGVARESGFADCVEADAGGAVAIRLDDRVIRCGKVVVCAGVASKAILRKLHDLFLYQGVGSAYLTEPMPDRFDHSDMVVRTVNRGGSQCGVHVVPRSDGRLYIGAGNYIDHVGTPRHRLETLRYLMSLAREEILGTEIAYGLVGQPIIGLRPRSLDTLPLIGPLAQDDRVFVATGTNRVGLTLGPVIAEAAANWLDGVADDRFAFADANRQPRPFGDMAGAADYFVASRVANLLEHSLIEPSQVGATEARLYDSCEQLNANAAARLGLPAGHVVNPDFWGLLNGRQP